MKLKEALPSLFRRPFPLLEPETRVLLAGTILDTPRRDVLKVAELDENMGQFSEKKDRFLAFSGYTLLARLLEIDREEYYKFLYEPCWRASKYASPVASNAEIATVLEEFARTRIGWSFVEENGKYDVISLSDFISFYQSGIFETDLTVPDVASQEIFTMPSNTRLGKALQEMRKRKIRRIFLPGNDYRFVSDREILTYIFSSEQVNLIKDDPGRMLDAALEDVGAVDAIKVDGRPTIKNISRLFKPESGMWCLVCSTGLVTPWDLVVKPWNMGRLKIREIVGLKPFKSGISIK